MTTSLVWALIPIISIYILFTRSSILFWALAVSGLVGLMLYSEPFTLGVLVTTVLVAAAIILLLVRPLRIALISSYVMSIMAKVIPPISTTEREALEAGSVWWEAELFNGKPDWAKLFAIRKSALSDAEQAFIDGPVETLCEMIDDWKITHEQCDLPEPIWQYIREQGFFGLIIPKKYGGLEFSALAHSSIVVKIASRSISAAVTVMVPNSLGPAELLLRYGSDTQRNYYLPRQASGEDIPCFALTEPKAGSDAASLSAHGRVCYQQVNGKKTLGVLLNWQKRYITLGPCATLLGLAFRLYDPDSLLSNEEDRGITLALIPTDTKGVEIGLRHYPMNLAFKNGPNTGKDVFIAMDKIIGGPEYIGQGWQMLMDCLSVGRSISLPALSTGAGKLATRLTGAYCHIRQQFKRPLGEFEGIQQPLARIAGYTYMLDAARKLTTSGLDNGEQPAVVSAIVKYQFTEHMRHLVNDAMDIHAGNGICLGPKNTLARIYQAIPISITVEGANILTRSLIIYGQGALRCHPHLYPLMKSCQSNNVKSFDKAFMGLLADILSKMIRAPLLAMGVGRLLTSPYPSSIAKHISKLNHLSAAFALISDTSVLVLGSGLKSKESLSGRMADAIGYLYLGSACLKQFNDDECPDSMQEMLDWVMTYCLHNINKSLNDVIDNFPNRTIAVMLRRFCFMPGRHYPEPKDVLTRRISKLITSPGVVRDALTEGMFIPKDPDETLAKIEDALLKSIEAEVIEKRIYKAIKSGEIAHLSGQQLYAEAVKCGVITASELDSIVVANQARDEVIAVDALTEQELTPTQGRVEDDQEHARAASISG